MRELCELRSSVESAHENRGLERARPGPRKIWIAASNSLCRALSRVSEIAAREGARRVVQEGGRITVAGGAHAIRAGMVHVAEGGSAGHQTVRHARPACLSGAAEGHRNAVASTAASVTRLIDRLANASHSVLRMVRHTAGHAAVMATT